MEITTQKITPFLWFDGKAEEAMNFYMSIFKKSKVHSVSRYPAGGPEPAGTVMTASFQLNGLDLIALNAGPMFKFTPAISFFVNCASQEEVDELWDKLLQGGSESQCGWLVDQFGLSWQIIPEALTRLMSDKDPEKSKRVMMAMMKMKKIIVKDLQDAYDNK